MNGLADLHKFFSNGTPTCLVPVCQAASNSVKRSFSNGEITEVLFVLLAGLEVFLVIFFLLQRITSIYIPIDSSRRAAHRAVTHILFTKTRHFLDATVENRLFTVMADF